MHSFEVHSNESACRKSGRLGLEQAKYILVSAVREYREAACLVRVLFGGLGVGVDNCGKYFVVILFLLGVDVVAGLLM